MNSPMPKPSTSNVASDPQSPPADPIRVGISRCLLGDQVRYDGQHKRSTFAAEVLAEHFQFVPVCPEVEVGMSIPREPVRLVGLGTENIASPRMVAPKSGIDWTEKMNRFCQRRVRELESLELNGFILQQKSPSCGMERVKLFGPKNQPRSVGVGLFAAELMKQYPLLPVEEEGRLNDMSLRENFLVRVFSYSRLRKLFKQRWSRGKMVEFHSQHKYLLMAHQPAALKTLGRLVAEIKQYSAVDFRNEYGNQFMHILNQKTTVKKNVNVMQHLMGYLKKVIGSTEKSHLLSLIEDYQARLVPLIVPLTVLQHYFILYPSSYVEKQVYLWAHPKELMLRNHV